MSWIKWLLGFAETSTGAREEKSLSMEVDESEPAVQVIDLPFGPLAREETDYVFSQEGYEDALEDYNSRRRRGLRPFGGSR